MALAGNAVDFGVVRIGLFVFDLKKDGGLQAAITKTERNLVGRLHK